ncbi:MAG TPA: hypothetical protein DEA55_09060 [Rhodospirillaceae bacterium]|nr:hypothetical protein [Rhodospirillaceae bacterium]
MKKMDIVIAPVDENFIAVLELQEEFRRSDVRIVKKVKKGNSILVVHDDYDHAKEIVGDKPVHMALDMKDPV